MVAATGTQGPGEPTLRFIRDPLLSVPARDDTVSSDSCGDVSIITPDPRLSDALIDVIADSIGPDRTSPNGLEGIVPYVSTAPTVFAVHGNPDDNVPAAPSPTASIFLQSILPNLGSNDAPVIVQSVPISDFSSTKDGNLGIDGMEGILALHAFAIDQSRLPGDSVDAFDASSGAVLMGPPPSSPSYMRDSPEAEIASGDPESPPSKKVCLVRPNPTVLPPPLDLNVPFVPLESLPGTRRWPYSPEKARVLHIGKSQSIPSSERGVSPSRSMSPVTHTQGVGPHPSCCSFKEEGSAGDHWHQLLRKYPESTRELLFRLPWYTAPGVTLPSGVPHPYVNRVVCKAVPLDLTWGEVTLALNASTPLNLIGTRLYAGHKDLFLDQTVRQSRVPAFTTIGILGRERGGAFEMDSDSDEVDSDGDDSEAGMPLEVPQFIQDAIDSNQEAATISELGFNDEAQDAAPQQGWASGLVNGMASNLSAVLFSPAVESTTPAPPVPRPAETASSGIVFSPAVESPASTPAPPVQTSSSITVPDLALKRSSAIDTGENNEGGIFDEKERVSDRTQSSKRHENIIGREICHDRIIMLFFYPVRSFFPQLLFSVVCSFFSQNLLIWGMCLSGTTLRYSWAVTDVLWKDHRAWKMKWKTPLIRYGTSCLRPTCCPPTW